VEFATGDKNRKTEEMMALTNIFRARWPQKITSALFLLFWGSAGAQIPFTLEVSPIDSASRGEYISVPVTKTGGSEPMQGFEFVFTYDYGALTFTDAIPGELFDIPGGYEWEHFDYQAGIFQWPVYDSTYPPHMGYYIKISGLADEDNGSHAPLSDQIPDGTVLFNLKFYVSADVGITCAALPIMFFWMDCGDNTILYGAPEDPMYAISNRVLVAADGWDQEITDPYYGFPGYFGAPGFCLDSLFPGGSEPLRFIDFYNHYVSVECDSSNLLRGDININGIDYELADLFLFKEALVHGLSAFGDRPDLSVLASDINGDMHSFTIEDFILMNRIIAGEMSPYEPSEDTSWGIPVVFETDTSIILATRFGIPVGGIYLWYYAPRTTSYAVSLSPHAVQMDVEHYLKDDSIRVLIYNDVTDGFVFDSISPEYDRVVELTYTGEKPRLMSVTAGGYYGEKISLPPINGPDLRGDLNLNGIADEIADLVVYVNYFLQGLSAFTVNPVMQTAASEINGDGKPLTVQDLVYLKGIITGTFLPFPYLHPEAYERFGGYLDVIHTDSSIIIRSDFEDSVGALQICFYAPDLQTPEDYEIRVFPGIDSADVAHNIHDDSLKILIIPSLLSTDGTAIPPGERNILELLYTGEKPSFAYADAAGYLAQYVDLVVSSLPNSAPVFEDYPAQLANDYYGGFHYDFNAVDPDEIPDVLSYEIVSGPGSIESSTGIYRYSPVCVDIGSVFHLEVCVADRYHPCPQENLMFHAFVELVVSEPTPLLGDADGNGTVDLIDIVRIIDYLYRGGAAPISSAEVADVNSNGAVNLLDVVYLIAYLYMGGPAPHCS
jgi:hypothetical protein